MLRIYGYENIPSTPLPKPAGITPAILSLNQKRVHLAKRGLANRGMLELKTWSFIPSAQAATFGGANPALTLLNPISADLDTMRPSLLPNLLDAAKRNAARGFKNISLFEVGLQFHDITPDGQKIVAAGIHTGTTTDNNYEGGLFTQKTRNVDAMDAKADVTALLQALGVNKLEISTANLPDYYHPNRSGAFVLGKTILAYFGEIHPKILSKICKGLDLVDTPVAFEVFLDNIPVSRSKGTARPQLKISDYQSVERDFAFIVDENISVAQIEKEINKADKNLITNVEIFDVYSGKGVDSGKKSVAVKVTLQSYERTLTDSDITAISSAIITAASKGFGGILR